MEEMYTVRGEQCGCALAYTVAGLGSTELRFKTSLFMSLAATHQSNRSQPTVTEELLKIQFYYFHSNLALF